MMQPMGKKNNMESRKCQHGKWRHVTATREVALCLLKISGRRHNLTQIEGFIKLKCQVKYQIQASLHEPQHQGLKCFRVWNLLGVEITPQVGRATSEHT